MLTLLLGLIVGAVLGLTGAGGSILAVPLLMAGMGWTLPQAAPVALLAVCASAAFGTVVAWDVTYVRRRAAVLMGVMAVITAPLGISAAAALPLPILTALFAVVLVVVAARMLHQAIRKPGEAAIVRATVSGDGAADGGRLIKLNERGRIIWGYTTTWVIALIGGVTGFLAGLLGVGGGFVIVPSLRLASGLSMHSAIATSLFAIALIAAAGVAGAMAHGVPIAWAAALPFVAGALAGMYGGRRLAPRIAGARLQETFAVLMLVVAAGMLVHAVMIWER
ncbi:MAG: sulfite exporter TauE/SafE family protein [Gammaproteobacteria bacterium]